MNDVLEFVRGLVRPVVTVGLLGAAVVAVFIGKLDAEWLAGTASLVAGFWFQARNEK